MKNKSIYLCNLILILCFCLSAAQAVEPESPVLTEFGACFYPETGVPKFLIYWKSNDNPQIENSTSIASITYALTNEQGQPTGNMEVIAHGTRRKETGHNLQTQKLTTIYVGETAETGQIIQYAKLKFVNGKYSAGEVTYDGDIKGPAMCVTGKTQRDVVDALEKHKHKQLLTGDLAVCKSFPTTIAVTITGALLIAYLCS